jgi:hypothetical protein
MLHKSNIRKNCLDHTPQILASPFTTTAQKQRHSAAAGDMFQFKKKF